MKFNSSLNSTIHHVDIVSSEVFPQYQSRYFDSPREIFQRLYDGKPLISSKPKSNFPLNGKFFNDKFDVLDTILRHSTKLNKELKEQQLKEKERRKKEHEEFIKWKESQSKSVDPPSINVVPPSQAIDKDAPAS